MQQWLPDNLDFESSGDGTQVQKIETPDFIEDRPENGAASFLNRLDADERQSLMELIENDIRAEIQQDLYSQYGNEIELLRATLKPLSDRVEKAVAEEMTSIARGTVELAIAIGERLARQAISTDNDYIVRCIEELHERTVPGAKLTIIANPLEIAKLKKCQSDLDNLNIVALTPDQSLDVGGCIVQALDQEWDLTFRSQAEALADQVRDAIINGGRESETDTPVLEPVS